MKKLRSALAHIINHPKESWNIVTKHDKSFGYYIETDDPNGAVVDGSFLGSIMVILAVICIIATGIMIWILTVIYRLGSQAQNACDEKLIDGWNSIGTHLVFAVIASALLPGIGHLYLIYVLIQAEMKFSGVRNAVYKTKLNAKDLEMAKKGQIASPSP